jgi:hypothetical protein
MSGDVMSFSRGTRDPDEASAPRAEPSSDSRAHSEIERSLSLLEALYATAPRDDIALLAMRRAPAGASR